MQSCTATPMHVSISYPSICLTQESQPSLLSHLQLLIPFRQYYIPMHTLPAAHSFGWQISRRGLAVHHPIPCHALKCTPAMYVQDSLILISILQMPQKVLQMLIRLPFVFDSFIYPFPLYLTSVCIGSFGMERVEGGDSACHVMARPSNAELVTSSPAVSASEF